MTCHNFCILEIPPKDGETFCFQDLERYARRVDVEDDLLAEVADTWLDVPCYWNEKGKGMEKGLAYFGITLIPPASAAMIASHIQGQGEFAQLSALLQMAAQEEKYVLHFGI